MKWFRAAIVALLAYDILGHTRGGVTGTLILWVSIEAAVAYQRLSDRGVLKGRLVRPGRPDEPSSEHAEDESWR